MKHPQAGRPRNKRKLTLPIVRFLLSINPARGLRSAAIRRFFLPVLFIATFASCTVVKQAERQPGVILVTKKARYVGGNAKHFQQRYDARARSITKN